MKVSAKYIPCDCGGRAVRQFAPAKFKIGGRTETVEEIPAFVCAKCGEVYFDGPSIIKVERKFKHDVVIA